MDGKKKRGLKPRPQSPKPDTQKAAQSVAATVSEHDSVLQVQSSTTSTRPASRVEMESKDTVNPVRAVKSSEQMFAIPKSALKRNRKRKKKNEPLRDFVEDNHEARAWQLRNRKHSWSMLLPPDIREAMKVKASERKPTKLAKRKIVVSRNAEPLNLDAISEPASSTFESTADHKKLIQSIKPKAEPFSFIKLLMSIDIISRIKWTLADLEAKMIEQRELNYELFIQIPLVFHVFTVAFTIWDIVATTWLELSQLTWLGYNGLFWCFLVISLPMCIYGYIMAYLHHDNERLRWWAAYLIGTELPLLAIRLWVDWYYFNFRYEGGSYYGLYEPGPNNIPHGYDPTINYQVMRRKKIWVPTFDNDFCHIHCD